MARDEADRHARDAAVRHACDDAVRHARGDANWLARGDANWLARGDANWQARGGEADAGRSGGLLPGSRKQESGARLREVFAHARRLWREFTGESAYERYVERHRREHPDHEPMTERQFWRSRADFDEANVSTGCC